MTYNKEDLKEVQDQYLDYPYPYRNPEDDKTRVLQIVGEFLPEINHYVHKGKQDFKNGYRVLIAGGGTGDSTVWLAEQLKDYSGAEVVYLDFSHESMKIAQERAKNRGLTNITWVNDSILNIPNLNLGKFDYFNCIGVLHHLSDPDLGLKIISDSLNENSGGLLMVYGLYGRTAIYQMQEALRMICNGVTDRREKLRLAKEFVKSTPDSCWVSKEGGTRLNKKYLLNANDHEVYDMLLHSQDRAYSIPQLYDFVEGAGLNLVDVCIPYERCAFNIRSYFSKDEVLNKKLLDLPLKEQQALCEIMNGNIIKHQVYVSNKNSNAADFYDLNNIPLFFSDAHSEQVVGFFNEHGDKINQSGNYKLNCYSGLGEVQVVLYILPHTKALFNQLKTKDKSFAEIFENVRKETGSKATDKELFDEFAINLKSLNTIGCIQLKSKK